VAKLDRSRRRRGIELLRNEPCHAGLTLRNNRVTSTWPRGQYCDPLRASSVREDTKSGRKYKAAIPIGYVSARKIRPALGAKNSHGPWRTT
jgi:hypothetical protein